MRRALLFSTLLLAGCGAVQQAQFNSAAESANLEIQQNCSLLLQVSEKEAAAFKNTAPHLEACSGKYGVPWPREKTAEISQCGREVMEAQIRPVSHSKELFDELLDKREEEHQRYADGSLNWEDLDGLMRVRLDEYFSKSNEGSYFSFTNCQNQIMSERLMPSYSDALKPVFFSFMSDLSEFARESDKKNLAREDFQVGYQRLWANFAQQEQQKISQVNAQNAQAWQNFGQQLQRASQQMSNQNSMRGGQCGAVDIPPMASIGCKNVCINGQWSEVCG
jgi:hypothetical protein